MKWIAEGSPSDAISLKLTTNISSSGLLDRTKARAAAITSVNFRPHAGAVIDNQPHGDRDIFVLEKLDALRYAVLVNLKIRLVQIGD